MTIRQPTPAGSSPRAAVSAASRPRTKRLSRSSGSSSRPSPSTVSSIRPRLQPRTSSSMRSVRASATPSSRTEVGRGCRHLDRDGAAIQFGEPVGDHGYQPSATATAPTVGAASIQGPTWRSAVVGSFRPCPVSTHATSASGSSSPAAAALRSPATPAADAGSQKIPRAGPRRDRPRGSRRRSRHRCGRANRRGRRSPGPRDWVADPDRGRDGRWSTRRPLTRGAAPAAWNPQRRGVAATIPAAA